MNMTSDIAKDGDIVLVVGEDQERLRVYSVVMTIVSQPFRALLGPHFKEGQQSSTPGTQLKEILLPEDNAVAMKVMCMVLHHQGETVGEYLSPTVLLEVAILADKYDCVSAVRLYGKTWIFNNQTEGETKALVKCAATAYIFDDLLGFERITRSLVLLHVGPFYGLLDASSRLVLPTDILCG